MWEVKQFLMEQDFFKLGVQAARSGDYQEAQRYFIQVVQANPHSEKGWLYLGHCLTDPQERKESYQEVLKLNPSNQEAQKALSTLNQPNQPQEIAPDSGKHQPAPLQSAEKGGQVRPAQTAKSPKRSRTPKALLIGLGASLFVCLGVIFVIFIGVSLSTGVPFQFQASLLPFGSVSPTVIPVLTATITPTKTLRSTMTPLPTSLPSATHDPSDGSTWLEAVNTPAGGVPLDATTPTEPQTADGYYAQAQTIMSGAIATGSQYDYENKIMQALENINAAIALHADVGNYYALRQSIYYKLAGLQTYTVDRQVFYRLALADAYKAHELGTSIEQYPDRIIISDLIDTDQCDLALSEIQKLMDKTPKTQSNYGGLLSIQSMAYSCLGKLDEAIQAIDASMFNNKNMEYKQELKAGYLFQAGRDDETLAMIEKIIICCPSYGGYRYLWRASIYYSRGQKDLARQDMELGARNTWSRGDFVAYMQAQFALDEGKKQEAVQLLQLAEASLGSTFNPFRSKIQKQLTQLGATPIAPTPSVSFPEMPSP
jgi:tetratricopeptide (TPR) repeat protein